MSRHEKMLALIFLLTLPLINPWVRGDGVGYYAYARSLLIEHRLDFEKDWLTANASFRMAKLNEQGRLRPEAYTRTGHLDNHFTVGPAILWAPFLIAAHLGVVLIDALGGHIPANGFSGPYVTAMAIGTAAYGFLGLLISYRLARKYFEERWAFLATLGIWFASSLPVYMYFNPSWSHAHSVFTVALFVYYWDRTRGSRTTLQWIALGLCAGLMIDVYYPNFVFLVLPGIESLAAYRRALRAPEGDASSARGISSGNILFGLAALAAFLPTIITRKTIYGSYLNFGDYRGAPWSWTAPAHWKVLFSSDHGLVSWTPILGFALLGLFLWLKSNQIIATYLIAAGFAFYYLIACYPDWDGLSSFGSRFFVSLTPIFVVGLAAFFTEWARSWKSTVVRATASTLTALFILWNLAFMFQWGTHMIPVRGPISFRDLAYNQVFVVPARVSDSLKEYFTRRKSLMNDIEQRDMKQLRGQLSKQSDPRSKESDMQ
ncbi:MAG: glycosyltransferase family 39 protein [Candidatus Acidiferrales bacterium]